MNIAVIPARGGSKRMPRKNVRDFFGKPMIAHSIERARESGLFDRIIVSTDDDEVAAVARHWGAEIPFIRPQNLADDYTGTVEVIAHAVDAIIAGGGKVGGVCCIYATAPLIQAADLAEAHLLFESGDWDFVFSATNYSQSIFRSFLKSSRGDIEMVFPEHYESRSQDLPEALHDAGQFYWGKATAWQSRSRIFGPKSTVVELPRWRVQDIDNETDWLIAEMIMTRLNGPARIEQDSNS